MTFLDPVWLLFLIPVGMLWFAFKMPSRLLRVMRAVLYVCVISALARPVIRLPERHGTVVVVADRSQSMPRGVDAAQKEAIDLIASGLKAGRDRLEVVGFGRRAAAEQAVRAQGFPGFANDVGREQSNLAEGLDLALSLLPADSAGRILVMSDGRWTGRDPGPAALRAMARGIGMDYRLMQRSQAGDAAIVRLEAPETVAPRESYIITAWVKLPSDRKLGYELKRGGAVLARGERDLKSGMNRLMFRDAAAEPGVIRYILSIDGGADDPVPENNLATLLTGVRGRKPLLCASASGDSALARSLRAGGLDVKPAKPSECRWTLEDLAGNCAVLLEDVAAGDLGNSGMQAIAAWVEQAGGGLMITGGRKSYGIGGYFRSPLEPVMPVSMELRKEHRKMSLAIAVALDRSGSMSMPAGGGKAKMDLADMGTVQVLDLLSEQDEIAVIAVDSSPHVIVGMNSVAVNRGARGRILQIGSEGGGIFIFEALSAAVRELVKAKAGTKHIILFADAADSEEPGKYVDLIAKCRQANVTISVIGLGTPKDCDAKLLMDIAARGGGQCMFTVNPGELPRLFAQDTFAVARSTFVEDPTPVRFAGGMSTLSARQFGKPPDLGGYNLCYARPEAVIGAVSVDEFKAPIVAAWPAGSGRALCFMGEADGPNSGPFAKWDQVGSFYASLARWTMGDSREMPENMMAEQQVQNGMCRVRLYLDPERDKEPFSGTPRVKALKGLAGEKPAVEERPMEWVEADILQAEVPMSGAETVLATLDIPGVRQVSLPPVCLPYSPEFEPSDPGRGASALKSLCAAGGGGERLDLQGIWKAMPRGRRPVEIANWLAILSVILLLLEVLQRRTGVLSRPFTARDEAAGAEAGASGRARVRMPWPRRGVKKAAVPGQAGEAEAAPAKPAEKEPKAEPEAGAGTLDAMRRARAQAKRRMD